MKKIISIVIVFVLCISMCSCQATPETIIVDNKGDENNIVPNSSGNVFDCPDNWQHTIEKNNLYVEVDASVIVPDFDIVSLQKVVPDPFTKDQIIEIIDSFFPNSIIYDQMQQNILSKSDIEKQILTSRRVISEIQADTTIDNDTKNDLIADRNEYISDLEEMYKSAPETVQAQEISITDELIETGAVLKFVNRDLGNVVGSMMIGSTSMENGMLTVLHITFASSNDLDTLKSDSEPTLNISVDKARESAAKAIQSLGVKDYTLDRLEVKEVRSEGRYQAIYVPYYDELPETYTNQNTDANAVQPENYDIVWYDEFISIEIGNDGIKQISWQFPAKAGETVQENIALLDFEEIQEKFSKQIVLQEQAFEQTSFLSGRKIYIDEIRLGVMKLKNKGNQEHTLTPVWDFFGYSIDKYKEQRPGGVSLDENMEHTNNTVGHSFLTINALDGTVIDRTKGY